MRFDYESAENQNAPLTRCSADDGSKTTRQSFPTLSNALFSRRLRDDPNDSNGTCNEKTTKTTKKNYKSVLSCLSANASAAQISLTVVIIIYDRSCPTTRYACPARTDSDESRVKTARANYVWWGTRKSSKRLKN